MTPLQIEAVAVATGLSATWLTHLTAVAIASAPILHALGLLVSIVVGLLSAAYTIKKLLKK